MLVNAGVADDKVDIGIRGEIVWGTVGLCIGGKIVCLDGCFGGCDAAVEEGDDLEL